MRRPAELPGRGCFHPRLLQRCGTTAMHPAFAWRHVSRRHPVADRLQLVYRTSPGRTQGGTDTSGGRLTIELAAGVVYITAFTPAVFLPAYLLTLCCASGLPHSLQAGGPPLHLDRTGNGSSTTNGHDRLPAQPPHFNSPRTGRSADTAKATAVPHPTTSAAPVYSHLSSGVAQWPPV